MSTARKQWLLKVIAGPHQGAEILLSAGKTLVGSDDACDVVLHDVLVAPQHVELELTDTGITAAPLGGRVFASGKRIRDSRQSVSEFVFVSIGGTHFVIGNAAAKWPLLSAADVPELEKEVEVKAEPAANKEESAPAPSAGPSVVAPVTATPSPVPAASRIGPLLGIAAGVMILIIWAVVYEGFFGVPNPITTEAPASNKPADRVRQVIADMELTDSVKVVQTGGRITVTGYVDTESRQRELQAAFREAAPGLHTKIYSLEKIVSSARSMIADQHLDLSATSLSEGRIKVTGQLASAEPWVRMKQKLLREVPGLSNIEDGVEIAAPPLPIMAGKARLAAYTPTIRTVYLPAPQSIVPTPSAIPAPAPAEDPNADYAITANTIDTPESTVASIKTSAEGLNFMRLSTGGIYFVGARLPYGGNILKIEADAATIHERGVTRIVRIGDLVAQTRATSGATGKSSLTKSTP